MQALAPLPTGKGVGLVSSPQVCERTQQGGGGGEEALAVRLLPGLLSKRQRPDAGLLPRKVRVGKPFG